MAAGGSLDYGVEKVHTEVQTKIGGAGDTLEF
jgi:hypothetical protein